MWSTGLRRLGEGMSVEGGWGPGGQGCYPIAMDEAWPCYGNAVCSLETLKNTDR